MITFLDEKDVEYGALATIKATNAVNGERSLTGTIVSGDYVLSNIERGWRLRFDDEYYVVTYAKPIDEGRDVQVTFDAVHQFFWDFDKSSVYDQLPDGSHTFAAYLDFIFKKSGYSYTVDSALNVYAFEKQSFGLKKRLTLFNDIITSTGVEFQVNGKVVRILEKVGTDLSTVVRKNFNMNELTIEKNIGDFVTYQKGYGAYFDEENHSKGRLVAEYTSPLASVYGKLEAEPFVDERYKQSSSLLSVLKENVDNSYTISVSLDMEDLTRAGYKYKQPVAGDYIMAINETLDFQEKIRIVSFASEYDVQGILVKHEVTCNDIGTVKKLAASYNLTKKQASSASATASNAYSIANKALVSADGKNTNYYTNSFPIDNPKGTIKTGDLLFLTVGDTVKQYYWNGTDWITNPVVNDVEAFKEQIADELKDVPNREEFENKIAEELANSKAEIETQIDTAKTQAESNAKAYADEINQATAEVAEQANTAANSLKSDLAKVKADLTTVTNTANSAKTSASEAKQQLTTVADDLSTAKQDLQAQASQLQAQANAQSELTKRVSSVEETANGTKTTVSELSKTVAQNGKDITSVTARTKTVEDDLTSTKTTLSQVQTTANSASQKTATLETGLDGVKADLAATTATANTTKTNLANYQANNDKVVANLQSNLQTANGNISSLQTKVEAVPGQITSAVSAVEGKIPKNVGAVNLFKGSRDFSGSNWVNNNSGVYVEDYQGVKIFKTQAMWNGRSQYFEAKTGEEYVFSAYVKSSAKIDKVTFYLIHTSKQPMASGIVSFGSANDQDLVSFDLTDEYQRIAIKIKITKDGWIMPRIERSNSDAYLFFGGYKLERGNIATDYSPAPEDTASQISSLSSQIHQTADGMTLLATKTELNTAKTDLQSGITTATSKADNAQSTANNNAQTISAHTTQISALNTGLSAKVSQTDFNTLSGRVTTAENNITAKANELSSKITSVEGKIPTSFGSTNLLLYSADPSKAPNGYYDFVGAQKTSETYNGSVVYKVQSAWNGLRVNLGNLADRGLLKVGDVLTYSVAMRAEQDTPIQARLFVRYTNESAAGSPTGKMEIVNLTADWQYVSVAFTITAKMLAKDTKVTYLGWEPTSSAKPDKYVYYACNKIERGNTPTDYSPSPEDYDSKLASAQSEIKQTTDSIKASVSSLDNSTVKSASLTINTDGIVMKAGKSTTDVANAIGSYFAVNQNAINLFTDKINVKANMIVDGAITSTKIASKSINTAHLNGKIITADVIATGAITADAIKAGAITTDKMSANSINGDRITAGTLDAAKIKAGSITASQIASGTITSSQIKTGGISAANIATGAITADKIAANAIDVSKITGDTANFVKAAFKSLYSNLDITGESLKFSSIVGNSFEISNTNYLLKLNHGAHYAGINPLNYGGISIGMGLAGLFSIRGVNRTDGSENIFLELSREQARIGTHTSYIRITNQKISIIKNNQVVQTY